MLDFKYISRVLTGAVAVIVVLTVLFNVCYQALAGNLKQLESTDVVKTETEFSHSCIATVFRNEQVIEGDGSGVLSYEVQNGEKVQNGKVVAKIYEDSENIRALVAQKEELQEQLSFLKSAKNLESSYSASAVDKKINELTGRLSKSAGDGNHALCARLSEEIQLMLCIKELKNGRTDYKEQIAELEKSIAEAVENMGDSKSLLKVRESGYFYSECDGYEVLSQLGELSALTLEQLEAAENTKPADNSLAVGKLVSEHSWQILVPITYEESLNFKNGNEYSVSFSNYSEKVTMKLEKTVRKAGVENSYLIMSCERIPSGFPFTRKSEVSIAYKSFEGFKIPLSALRTVEDYTGVYVLHGSVVEFRRVSITALDGSYAICDPDYVASEGNYISLKFYDKIIVEGEDLYVGKIIN